MFKDIVQQKKISLYSLAKRSGVSYTAINELYRGERTVEQCSGHTLYLISKVLHMSIDDLYNNSLKRKKIPSSLFKYFWDTDPEKLDLVKDKIYIISRLLDKGGYEGFIFLNKAYCYEDFKEVGLSSRLLTPKVAAYLANVFSIKKEDMRFYKKNIDWRKSCI